MPHAETPCWAFGKYMYDLFLVVNVVNVHIMTDVYELSTAILMSRLLINVDCTHAYYELAHIMHACI